MPSVEQLTAKRIIITGGRGFLGSAVVRELEARGADVVPLGRSDYDLVEQSEVRRMFEELKPQMLVHAAAAVGGIGANVANPGWFLYANSVMGLMLLEESRHVGLEKFILISSTCAYPESAPLPLSERDLWGGRPTGATGPYGIAKRMLHEACMTFTSQYGLDSTVLVMANLYGPGDHLGDMGHVVPSLIDRYLTAVERDQPSVTNWGTGRATREFLHVTDAARAVVAALGHAVGPEPVNVGTGEETSIHALANLIQRIVGYQGDVTWDTSKPDGQPARYLDVNRATTVMHWRADVALDVGINETVEWYRGVRR